MALDIVTADYPPGTSMGKYPPPFDPTIAESVVAAAVRLHMTNDYSAFVNLYDPAERSLMTTGSYAGLQMMFSNCVGVTFSQSYWYGNQELVTYQINYAGGVGFLGKDGTWGNKLHYINGRFYLSTVLDAVTLLVSRHVYDVVHGFSAPLASSYHYAFTYPPSGGLHPLKVLFNGTAMKLRIDTNTVASDELEAFMTNVVATYRSGSVDSCVALWSAPERDRLMQTGTLERALFRSGVGHGSKDQFNDRNVYLIFKLDFGPTAILYYQTTPTSNKFIETGNGVHAMTVFKDTTGHYLLTEQNEDHQVFFDDNVRSFLLSPEFVDFIYQQIPRQPSPAQ